MKKLLLTLLAVLLLLASCTIDATNPGAGPNEDPDTPVVNPSVKINLINRGDFEDFAENSEVKKFSWGSSNATVVLDDTNNKVVKLIATDADAFMYHTSTQSFSGSTGVLSAKIKLANVNDASKVRLVFGMKNTAGTEVEVDSKNPDANIEWQTVRLGVPDKGEEVYEAVFKVVAGAGCGEVLVDDVEFIPADYTKVNFMSFGNFEGNKDGKWKNIRSGVRLDIALDAHAADLIGGDELISDQSWTAGGSTSSEYPLAHIDYPNTLPGQVSFTASGNGTLVLKVELKRPVSDITNETAKLTDKTFVINGTDQVCTFDVPAEKENYTETTLHIFADSANKGTISVDNVKLSLK